MGQRFRNHRLLVTYVQSPTAEPGKVVRPQKIPGWHQQRSTQNRPNHQPPDVNYSPCFENADLSCRLHEKHVVCRVNHRYRNSGKSFTSGGWWKAA